MSERGPFSSVGQALSRREAEVLAMLARGLTDKETASRLGLAWPTIRIYRRRAEAKLGTKGLVQSVLVAWRRGELDLEAIAREIETASGPAGHDPAPSEPSRE